MLTVDNDNDTTSITYSCSSLPSSSHSTVNEDVEFERIATAARPGSSIKTAFQPRPTTSQRRAIVGPSHSSDGRLNTSSRPSSAMTRPGTAVSRPGSSLGTRPASRCGTASRVRATSAAAFNVGDSTSVLYQASRLNPTIYAERETIVKALFQFLFYHEADVPKAHSLCQAVMDVQRQRTVARTDWWWQQQLGRCLLALHYPRRAEPWLQQSLAAFPHPDTYLLLSRLYQRLRQPERALLLIGQAVERHPFDVVYRLEQARIHGGMSQQEDALQLYRLAARLQPINVEALASIAQGYFYDNNPEMALMYYRRILSLGVHTAELYCNIALCCLYGGQIDLVLPCFQRALLMATQPEQKADVWYNLSFVALVSKRLHCIPEWIHLIPFLHRPLATSIWPSAACSFASLPMPGMDPHSTIWPCWRRTVVTLWLPNRTSMRPKMCCPMLAKWSPICNTWIYTTSSKMGHCLFSNKVNAIVVSLGSLQPVVDAVQSHSGHCAGLHNGHLLAYLLLQLAHLQHEQRLVAHLPVGIVHLGQHQQNLYLLQTWLR